MRRADVPAYHGTSSAPFVEFKYTDDIGFHFGATPEVADARLLSDRIVGPNDPRYEERSRIMPVRLLISNPLRLPDLGMWDPGEVLEALRDAHVLTFEEWEKYSLSDMPIDKDFVEKALASKGYDSIVYRNETEYLGGEENKADSYIVFRPEQVKSAFNLEPSKESADITASTWRSAK